MIDFLRRVFVRGENPFTNDYEQNRMRPPGAVEEKRFMALCIRCNRCLEVCPYNSIHRRSIAVGMGTPYVFGEQKACYLCMACVALCPTGALDTSVKTPEQVKMGKAIINSSICYSHLFMEADVLPMDAGQKIAALCNTCYNVCPLQDRAIVLKHRLYPEITDACVGCGVCVERCPTRPARAINVTPTGMINREEAGFYFRRAKKHHETTGQKKESSGVLKMEELLDRKSQFP